MNIRTILFLVSCWLLVASCKSDNQPIKTTNNNRTPSQADTTTLSQQYSDSAVTGQTLYVPVYSHIYQQNRTKTFNLTATLSIRNTSMQDSMQVHAVQYYDSDGNLVRNYLSQNRTMGPLSSIAYVIDEDDLTGGIGANFIVMWSANTPISHPIVEAVMISTSHQQGISFIGTARIIDEF